MRLGRNASKKGDATTRGGSGIVAVLKGDDTPMNQTILTDSCPRCQRREAVNNAHAEAIVALEYDLATTTEWLATTIKVAIKAIRERDESRGLNRILRDENQYLRDTLNAEREIRNEPSEPRAVAA